MPGAGEIRQPFLLRWASVGGLLVALLLQPVAAPPAAPPPVELAWEAPPGCPDAKRILGEIARLLASTEPGPHRKRVRASAQPRRTIEGSWRLQLVVGDDRGETARRTLASRSCMVIADATALIVAIAIDPTIPVTAAPADAAPEPAPPVPASQPTPPIATELSLERPAPTPASRARFAAGVFGMGRQGVLPGVAGGAGVALAALVGRWRLDLSAGYVLPKDVYLASVPAAGARLSQLWLALAPCLVLKRRSLEFPLCAGLEGGALAGRGIGGAVAPTDGRQPWLALTSGAGTVWMVGEDVGIFVSAAAVLAVLRPAFDLGSEPVHRTPVLSGRLTLGAEWRFF
jgi:hypothetical protein